MMDSNKASTSTPNSTKPNCDDDQNKNYKSVSKQPEQCVNDEKVFTLTSNSSAHLRLNGSRSRLTNTSHDTSSQSIKPNESPAEGHKNLPSTSNSSSGKVPSNDSVTACSSRSSLCTNNGIEAEGQVCLRHRVCIAGSSNTPSTSGTSRGEDNIMVKENRKRPSSLKLNRPDVDDDSSTDTGNDDYSLGSEDGCIYTYRGGEHLADLPSSFFSLDMGLPLDRHLPMPPNYAVAQGAGNAREWGSRASSPDMDFLEMDFDPGPSCEVDSGEASSDGDLDADLNMQENDPVVNAVRGTSPEYFAPPARANPVPVSAPVEVQGGDAYSHAVPSTSRCVINQVKPSQGESKEEQQHTWYGPYITHVNARGEQLMVRRTMLHWAGPVNMHLINGDLMPMRESTSTDEEYPEGSVGRRSNWCRSSGDQNPAMPSAMYHLTMAKKLIADKQKEDGENQSSVATDGSEPGPSSSTSSISCVEPPRCMIWSEREACERQVTQIGTSACGATAVVNVFNALGVPVNIERINSSVGTRLRANTAPIPRYLVSRAVAGCTAAELAAGLHRASDGLVTARFFGTHPERAVSLSHWLADWISLGAVPILTQNLQNGCEGDIPDAWHHQMVFGVSPRGVFLCNPVECVREGCAWGRLAAPSELRVRARDVAARFSSTTDLTPLHHVPDARFEEYNVLGQVVNVIREWCAVNWQEHLTRTRYIRIPAAYQAGVTIAALTGSEAHRRLSTAPELPILHPQNDPA